MNKYLIALINILLVTGLHSQNIKTKDDSWVEYIHQIAESTENELNINNLYEVLSEIHEHPFNINQIKKEELERLPFLSDAQIENIQAYLYISGSMKTIYELKLVKDLDMETIRLLLPFVYLGQPAKIKEQVDLKNLLSRGKSRLYFRLDRNLDKKEGYVSSEDSTVTNKYLGSPFYSFVKYDFNAGNKLQLGFVVEKDAGERIRDGFRSFHFLMKDVGRIKRLALGRYKLSFGQGLAMNTNFSMGKSVIASSIATRPEGISRHYSTDELNYLQGVAATLDLGKSAVSVFVSARKAAATLSDSVLTSIKSDAYFNTENDLKQRSNVTILLAGVNCSRRFGKLKLGATAFYYAFDKSLQPTLRRDNNFAFRGRDNLNVSVDYQYRFSRTYMFGETAMSENGALASLNGMQYRLSSFFNTSLLQRSYSKSYHAYYGAAFSESSRVENEQGVYWGIEWNPFRYWKLTGYADVFHFPWLKYGVSAPSSGFDGSFQLDFLPAKNLGMYFRYRYKEKEKDISGDDVRIYQTEKYQIQRFRWQCDYSVQQFNFRTGIDFNRHKEESGFPTEGFALTQSISKSWKAIPLDCDIQWMVFDTDGYDSSVFSYEKSVLYAFSFPSFYGKGYRWLANVKYDLASRLTLWVKYAKTLYNDREEIGSGLEKINGSCKNDIWFLMRLKF